MRPLIRLRELPWAELGEDGGMLYYTPLGRMLNIIAAWGGGWDHVSVSVNSRPHVTPTWEEMQAVKNLFFRPEEVCMQLHPAEDVYINRHPGTLHIWRPHKGQIPTPPLSFV